MAYTALITDLNGVVRRFISEYESMVVTRRLGDVSEFKLVMDPREDAVADALIAERAIKFYEDTTLRFRGQIWEPLEINEGQATIQAKDPFGGLAWRRVRESTPYTAKDAGAIAFDRLAVQNGYADTFLIGEASIDRTGTLTDGSAVVTGLAKTTDLREGMGADLIGVSGAKIASVNSPTQVTLDKAVNLSASKDGVLASGSPVVTGLSDTSDLDIGMTVAGTGVPAGATIASIDTATQITLSANATASGTKALTITAPTSQTITFSEGASVPRTITYDPGKREDEIITELSAMSDGFFFRVDPLDDPTQPTKMGTLRVLYPDAGITRDEVRFGYGKNTLDNLTGFKLTHMLPVTRIVAASQDANGGRIAAAAEDTDASAEYGLFEDELTYTDVTDTTLLQAAADAGTKPTPPLTIELTPAPNAPLLFRDFDVGDFVRLQIRWGTTELFTWVRVVEAELTIDADGNPNLTAVTVETLSGARPNQDPSRLFRAQMDTLRRRQEALERRVQVITTTPAAAPAPPSSSGGSSGSSTPPPNETPPPAPPPAPQSSPVITGLSASGVNVRNGDGSLHRGVQISVTVDMKGHSGSVTVGLVGGGSAKLGGSGSAFIGAGPGSYTVLASVETSAGQAGASTSATVPSFTEA